MTIYHLQPSQTIECNSTNWWQVTTWEQ